MDCDPPPPKREWHTPGWVKGGGQHFVQPPSGSSMIKEELIELARNKGLYLPEDAFPEQLAEFRMKQQAHEQKTRSKFAHLTDDHPGSPPVLRRGDYG